MNKDLVSLIQYANLLANREDRQRQKAYEQTQEFRNQRLAALQEQERLCGTGPHSNLASVCMSLRWGVNGSADAWDPALITAHVHLLEMRLATWQQSDTRAKRVDNAVHELVRATIEEVKSYTWWQEGGTT